MNHGLPGDHYPTGYAIRVDGHLDPRWAAWFDGMTLSTEGDGTTVIHGPVPDQAALHGLLQRIRDLGVRLVSVAPIATPTSTGVLPTPDERTQP